MTPFKFGFDMMDSSINEDSKNDSINNSVSDNIIIDATIVQSNENKIYQKQNETVTGEAAVTTTITTTPVMVESKLLRNAFTSKLQMKKHMLTHDIIELQTEHQVIKPLRRIILSNTNYQNNNTYSPSSSPNNSVHPNNDNNNDTDIIPGIYEGGLKVWECSIDLCYYLAEQLNHIYNNNNVHENNGIEQALSMNGSTLELGCGHGLPGCLILRELMKKERRRQRNRQRRIVDENDSNNSTSISRSAATTTTKNAFANNNSPIVIFTDYNESVLYDATIPNILLNNAHDYDAERGDDEEEHAFESDDDTLESIVGLVAGDWIDLSRKLSSTHSKKSLLSESSSSSSMLFDRFPSDDIVIGDDHEIIKQSSPVIPSNGRFNLILAAETTYTTQAAIDTATFLSKHLKNQGDGGMGLVATKRYYFGVGGGVDVFQEACDKIKGLNVESIRQYDSGSGNIRELLRVVLVALE